MNNLTSNNINIGQKLLIPGTTAIELDGYYIVKKGDTLYSIALKNNLTVSELKKLNNLVNDTLSIGQKLKITKPIVLNETYIVKQGDSLYSIAKKFNTTVNELKRLNNLDSNLLNINQILLIPTK